MAISITATPSVLVEEEGTEVTLTISSSEPIPEGGLVLTVSSETVNALGQFDVLAAQPDNLQILGVTDDTNGFQVRLNAQTGTITLPVFDDSDRDSPLDLTFSVEPGEGYTVDESAGSVTLTIEDDEGGMTTPPDETPEPTPGTGLPLVSLNTGPDYLVEADVTTSAHVFNVTEGTIPSGGLLVGVEAPNLSEFNLDAIEVSNDGEIVNVREDGFNIRLIDFTTLINLPVASDGETEGLETASFTVLTGDGYEVNSDFSSGEFEIVDTAEEVPNNLSEPNDIISLASETELSPDNPQVKIIDTLEFQIGNRYKEDGGFTNVDATEDVDFYEFDLKAGDVVSFDVDAGVGFDDDLSIAEVNAAGVGSFLEDAVDLTLNVYDAQGNSLAYSNVGTGPGELFAGAYDPYIEFQAHKDGTFYLGLSAFPNGQENRLVASPDGDFGYDPFVPASGSGQDFGIDLPNFGEYELDISLNPDNLVDLPQLNRSNNTPPETGDPAQPGEPTVSLNFLDYTLATSGAEVIDSEVISDGLVENLDISSSTLALIVTTEGEIPEEGVVVTINSDIYLRDYFSDQSLFLSPFSPGAELIDVVTDDSGIETGFQLRIFEPNISVAFNAISRFADGSLENEVDGPETATFFLEGGEGYGVSSSNSQITTTFYDSLEQVPEPNVVPEVSMTISETEIIESEGTETTLNFSLSEPPSEEGVLVYVGGSEGFLPQFEVLTAEVSGGVFPIADGPLTGFYFKITEQEAAINLTVFEDPFEEGLQSYSLALQETPLYTIAEDAGEVNFTIADTPDSVLEVSLSGSEDVLVESENTAGVLTFDLSAPPLAEGVEVTVDAADLSEFDAEAFAVTGGEITEITDTGFSLNITDVTATVELPALSDEEAEGVETATFSLVESPEYLVAPDVSEATFTLVDIPEQVPSPTEELDSNDIIPEAVVLNLNPENTDATIRGVFSSLEPNGDFNTDRKDPTEDVDLYTFDLDAGDTVQIDIDSLPFESDAFEGTELQLDSELRLFDADGNELASVNNAAAPDEELSRDPYLEFTAESAGSYYVGVSQLGNSNYDPNVRGSGSGWIFPEIGVYYGEYELNVSLTPGNVQQQPTTEPVFGSLEADIIEVSGTSQLIFGGNSNDLIDASIGSTGNNRIYAGSGDDTLILGSGDRLVGGEGADKFFALSGGDNILTGGAGADQFWIATAETPDSANIITDFTSGEDVLGIAGLGIGFDDLSITQQ